MRTSKSVPKAAKPKTAKERTVPMAIGTFLEPQGEPRSSHRGAWAARTAHLSWLDRYRGAFCRAGHSLSAAYGAEHSVRAVLASAARS
jgi:hypothetical protein